MSARCCDRIWLFSAFSVGGSILGPPPKIHRSLARSAPKPCRYFYQPSQLQPFSWGWVYWGMGILLCRQE